MEKKKEPTKKENIQKSVEEATGDGGVGGNGVEGGVDGAESILGSDYPIQPNLDHKLALIEEQFRKGFDERFSVNNSAVHRSVSE